MASLTIIEHLRSLCTTESPEFFKKRQCLSKILLSGDQFKKLKFENEPLNIAIIACKIILKSYEIFSKDIPAYYHISNNVNYSIFEKTKQVYGTIKIMNNPALKNQFFEILEKTQKEEQTFATDKCRFPTLNELNIIEVFKVVEEEDTIKSLCVQMYHSVHSSKDEIPDAF